jgi:hypothetical protein
MAVFSSFNYRLMKENRNYRFTTYSSNGKHTLKAEKPAKNNFVVSVEHINDL